MEEEKKILNEEKNESCVDSEVLDNELNQNEEVKEESKKQNKFISFLNSVGLILLSILKTIGRWCKRMFFGASKELTDAEKFNVENIESPGKQALKSFFRHKLAIVALVIIVSMFGLSFIGSAFLPLDFSYSENMHKNLAPNFTQLAMPGNIADELQDVQSFGFYSVGLNKSGDIAVWGNTQLPISTNRANMSDIPSEIKKGNVKFIGAGYDHAIAITDEGKVVGWGEYDNAQYGDKGSLYGSKSQVIDMPDQLLNGTIDVSKVKSLQCGYQVSAIIMNDGSTYCWGNYASGCYNLRALNSRTDVERIVFTSTACAALLKDGSLWLGSAKGSYGTYEYIDESGKTAYTNLIDDSYLTGRTIVDIATTNSTLALLMDDGELIITGESSKNSSGYKAMPALNAEEKIIEIQGGTRNLVVRTNQNRVFSFGLNQLGQCFEPKTFDSEAIIHTCSFQTYITNAEGKLIFKHGFNGYFMGSDELGRDVFARIVNGGRMTLTIGMISVIIAAFIGIVIGVISGYFGGIVDMILMRVTEIFSAIPFLPFALILSAILAGSNVTETQRIMLIMVILGLLSWTGLAHMVRGQVLAEREKDFVLAAKSMGVKESRIAFKHILPNVISIILVSLTLDFAGCLLTESSLSYLGFGVQLPRPTWGNMLNGANNEIVIGTYWWRWLFPALFLLLSTISINIIGDTLRDVFDPKSNAER